MKIYWERIVTCGCGYQIRETTGNLPLDRVGCSMLYYQEREFAKRPCKYDLRHKHKCGLRFRYSEWIIRV